MSIIIVLPIRTWALPPGKKPGPCGRALGSAVKFQRNRRFYKKGQNERDVALVLSLAGRETSVGSPLSARKSFSALCSE